MHRVFVFLMSLLLLVACSGDPQVTALLDRVDSLTYEQPDSALRLLQQHEAEASAWPRSQQMRHALLTARAQNKAFVDFTTDSMLLELTDYYDRHGTPNQQMEAHYLLGCVYRDLGEVPRAIECFQDAVDRIDTTATDCDYRTLGCVYSQMADMYHQQLLLNFEIEARQQAGHNAFATGDTLNAILEKKLSASAYILQNEKDTAEDILQNVIEQYYRYNYVQEGLQASLMLLYLYVNQPSRLNEAKHLMDKFESESSLFDERHELKSRKRQYYYYKGQYYEGIHQLDSAEFYYRKVAHSGMGITSESSIYKGLLSVYTKRHNADSIAKYARLYCATNDSSIAIKDQELTARLAASYNYSHYQKEALDNAEKAHVANIRFIVLAALLVLLAAGAAYFVKRNRKRREEQNARYHVAIVERNKLQKEVESLNAKDYESVITQKEQEIALLNQTIERQSTIYHRVTVSDRLSDFEKSRIVQVFLGKRTYHKELTVPTGNEWKALVSQFRQDMPSAYATMSSLSPLQLQVCVLLILGFEEGEIAYLRQTKPQVINTAKVRANQKLFLSNDSASLKDNLMGLITS